MVRKTMTQTYGLKITSVFLVLIIVVTLLIFGNITHFDQIWIKNLKNEYLSKCQEDVYSDLSAAFVSEFPDPKRFFIYKCQRFCGGLGDRQKGIVGAYLLSLLTNRTFGIVHTTPMSLRYFVRPVRINWNIPRSKLKGLSFQEQYAVGNITFVKTLPSLNLTAFYSKDIVYFHGNLEYVSALRRHYNAHKVFPIIRNISNSKVYRFILNMLFKLSKKVADVLNRIYSENIGNRKLICAHVRMGRNEAMPTDNRINLRLNDINKIWKFLDKYNDSTVNSIFVASDSNRIIALAKRRYNTQYIDVPGQILHIDKVGSTKRGNVTEGMKRVFLEQSLLTHCDVLVITKSGFGRIAAYLRNKSHGLYCYLNYLVFPCKSELLEQLYHVR